MAPDRFLDLTVLERLLGGNRHLMEKFARRFLDAAHGALAEIEAALGANNVALLRHLGHRTRSAALTLGATEMAELCRQLEHLPDDLNAAAPVVAELRSALAATAARLHQAAVIPANAGTPAESGHGLAPNPRPAP